MPSTWTSEHDAQLFYFTIQQFKVQGKDLVAAWKKKYGKDKATSASAIDQHIGQLRKKHTLKTPTKTLAALPVRATPADTPSKVDVSKPKTPKTPTTPASGSKRKRGNDSEAEMSDEDVSDAPTSKQQLANLPKRENAPRRSKTPKTYAFDSDNSDNENEETISDAVKFRPGAFVVVDGDSVATKLETSKARGGHSLMDETDKPVNLDGASEDEPESRTPTVDAGSAKKRFMAENLGDESDVSDYSPLNEFDEAFQRRQRGNKRRFVEGEQMVFIHSPIDSDRK